MSKPCISPTFQLIVLGCVVFFSLGLSELPSSSELTNNPSLQSKKPESKRGAKAGKVLLMIEESNGGELIESDAVSRMVSQKLSEKDLSVTSVSEIGEPYLARLRRAIQKLQQGDKKSGNSIPYAVIITGKVSTIALDPFNGLYMADASGTLKAIDTDTGKAIAIESITEARGFGNSKDQAARAALKKAGEIISESFIKHVSAAAG